MKNCVLIDIEGYGLTEHEEVLLNMPQVAGVVLFTKNYLHRGQLINLVHSIRQQRSDALILVDQEGGQVQRFGAPDFTEIPSAKAMAVQGQQFCHDMGATIATELLACGIDGALAPVLDLHDLQSPIIGQRERAFSAHVDEIVTFAGAFIDGMNEAGMQAVGKHFPGHGSVMLDSHTDVIRSNRSLASLESSDIMPFKALQDKLAAIMMAHITFTDVDDTIVGASERWRRYVRETMGYEGCIISDCLSMAGSAFDTVDERAGEVQLWVDNVRQYHQVCDLVIMTHLLDDSFDSELDIAKLEQILLTAFPPSAEPVEVDRSHLLRGRLSGEFVQRH